MSARFDAATYVTVAERVQRANKREFEIIETTIHHVNERWGYIQVSIKLDGRKFIGTASFRLDLQGARAQATNPIEDAETSAVGRALAMAGISSDRSVASLEEVQEAQRRADAPALSNTLSNTLETAARLKSLVGDSQADNVVTLPSAETTIGEMLDEITKAIEGIDQGRVIEFLRAKKKDVADAVDVWTLPEATIREIHDKLPKFRPAIERWMSK